MPNEVKMWRCAICSKLYDSEALAFRCEEEGSEETPEWLRPYMRVFIFSERGILGVSDERITVSYVSREHLAEVGLSLSRNSKWDAYRGKISFRAIDPMSGSNFPASVDKEDDPLLFEETARLWIETCRTYKISPDLSQASWALSTRRGRELADRIRELLDEDEPVYHLEILKCSYGVWEGCETIPRGLLTTERLHHYGIYEDSSTVLAHFDKVNADPFRARSFSHTWIDENGISRESSYCVRWSP